MNPMPRLRFLHAIPTVFAALLLGASTAAAQAQPSLRLDGIYPDGLRMSVTEAWGSYRVDLTNRSNTDRLARVVLFYEGRPDVQYGRDLWAPANSSVAAWMLVGPAPRARYRITDKSLTSLRTEKTPEPLLSRLAARKDKEAATREQFLADIGPLLDKDEQAHFQDAILRAAADQPEISRTIQYLLYDRTDGTNRLIPPSTEEHVRDRAVLFHAPDPFTVVFLDESSLAPPPLGLLPHPDTDAEEAVRLALVCRSTLGMTEGVHSIYPGSLPPTPEAFGGVDHFILASNRIADDPVGMRALRQWLERGGKVWVMLDMVDPATIAPLLGDALDFLVVDRVGLTSFKIESPAAGQWTPPPVAEMHDRPIEFVRVVLPAQEQPQHEVDGWPVWFTRDVGKGKVLFTTLGARAWSRPRTAGDPAAPFRNHPSLPVPLEPLKSFAAQLSSPKEEDLHAEALRPLLTGEIGYSIVSRLTVGLVFGGFLLGALAAGVFLHRSRRSELLGWLGPAAALGAAAVLYGLGEASRRSAPPTTAVVQIVDAVPGMEEAAVHGMIAVYRPDSGPVEAGANQGGLFEPDTTAAEGQTRSLIQTDMDAWHLENLSLPAGLRMASFQYTMPTGEPLTAIARFGPAGVEGKLTAGPFRNLSDAVVTSPNGRTLAVRLGPDGAFRASGEDILPADQFLAGAVLSDLQQRRQEVYREFLKRPAAGRPEGRNFLLAWADPIDMHFTLAHPGARTVGSALLVLPLQLERPAAGSPVIIPAPLIPCKRIINGTPTRPAFQGSQAADMHLRFQLPPSALPLKIERARLTTRLAAPSRRATIAAITEAGLVELYRVESPLDPIRIDIIDERALRLDREGGLNVNLTLSDSLQSDPKGSGALQADEKWTIEYLEMEIVGTAASEK